MTHKRFHLIRWISMVAIVVLIIFNNLRNQAAGNDQAGGSGAPIIVAALIGIAFVLLFGRIICGFFCPLGFFQDIIWKVTEKLHLPKLPRNEKFMKIINVFNKIFLVFFICGVTALTVISIFAPEILKNAKIPILVPVLVSIIMIVVNSFARRFFCNVCPIGSFIGLFEKVNIIKLEKDCGECTLCGACYEACPMRIKEIYTETVKSNVSSPKCMYCGECIKKCPEDNALAITVCGKKIYKSSQEDFMINQFTDISLRKGLNK